MNGIDAEGSWGIPLVNADLSIDDILSLADNPSFIQTGDDGTLEITYQLEKDSLISSDQLLGIQGISNIVSLVEDHRLGGSCRQLGAHPKILGRAERAQEQVRIPVFLLLLQSNINSFQPVVLKAQNYWKMQGKVIIVSAPSGAGKTSIVRHLLQAVPELQFSISATTRAKRDYETDGKDYYFITPDEFKKRLDNDEFLEWQEVYENQYYGSLKSEVERIWQNGQTVIFDVDVLGGLNIKKFYDEHALAIFIEPPSVEELANRLRNRGTESPESFQKRLDKAEYELSFSSQFDKIILNDVLEQAQEETIQLVKDFLNE
jgi:guanylate kinase